MYESRGGTTDDGGDDGDDGDDGNNGGKKRGMMSQPPNHKQTQPNHSLPFMT
jgi:hypothetical protein